MSASLTTSASGSDRPKKRWLAYFGVNSLAISILIHVLCGVGATYLIVEHFQKKHVNFHASEPPTQHTEVEHKVQLVKKNNVESAPPDLKRIVTTAVSPIALPDVPEVPQNTEITPSAISGDGVMGSGLIGSGGGTGGPGGPGGEQALFGTSDGAGLQGYLYDLKQTDNRKPTGMSHEKYHAKISEFIRSDWSPSILRPYYKSPKVLMTTSIFIPTIDAADGPKAFGAENEVQPNMYVVWYRGAAIVPQDGTYHFVGVGDDIIAVRINGKTVLDGSLSPVDDELRKEQKQYPTVNYNPTNPNDRELWVGIPVHLQAGKQVSIEVLIGEEPGGWSNYFLFIKRDESAYRDQTNNIVLLPIFQLDPSPIHPHGNYPAFQTIPDPWQAVSGEGPLAN